MVEKYKSSDFSYFKFTEREPIEILTYYRPIRVIYDDLGDKKELKRVEKKIKDFSALSDQLRIQISDLGFHISEHVPLHYIDGSV